MLGFSKRLLLLVILLCFSASAAGSQQFSCDWELQIWNSPYHDQNIYNNRLGLIWCPGEHFTGRVTFPLQISSHPLGQSSSLFFPQFSLAWSKSFKHGISAACEGIFDWHDRLLGCEISLHILADPLLTCYSFARRNSRNFINTGLVFAVNESWALGAQLQYGKVSLLTYQLHRISRGNRSHKLSYTHSVDGSTQCLALKIAF